MLLRSVLSVAVVIVAVSADCVEGIALATRADGQRKIVGTTEVVVKTCVVQIYKAAGHVAI